MTNAGRTAAVVLAAGSSTRFGSPKALASLWGRPLLQHVLDTIATLGFAEVVVVLGRDVAVIEEGIRWRQERRVVNPDPEAGLSGSLRIGLGTVGVTSEAAVIFLGDQPAVRPAVVERLVEAGVTPAKPIAAPRYAAGGGPNPLLIHRAAWPLALDARADTGLGPLLRRHPDLVTEVPVSGSNPDVDTPEELAALELGPPLDERVAPIMELSTIVNLRDVGGYATSDGRRVRTGLLFRSGTLDHLADGDAAVLSNLGIRTVYDLRSTVEREQQPDLVPDGMRHVAIDVLEGVEGPNPSKVMVLMRDPEAAQRLFGNGRGAEMFFGQYRGFVDQPGSRQAFGAMFRDLAAAGSRPALIHCHGGKDRTGWAAASLLLLLGVPEDAVLADFMASNTYLGRSFKTFLDDIARQGGDPELLGQFSWVRPGFLDASLERVRECYGTIDGYFADGLGLERDAIEALRRAFLE